MAGRLARLELENFKSYYGKQIIGPFDENFVCVIGPNGAGKSNVMDAISFVLGLHSGQLRSQQLTDLIYRRSGNERSANFATVTAVYRKANGEEMTFARRISASGASEYRINGRTIPYADYVKVWEGENVLIKARNFLVFQGDVEAIASKSPKELTKLFEQISGSEEYREEYERCKVALDRAVEDSSLNFNKKRGVGAELKLVQEQREDVLKFEGLQEQRESLQSEYYLWKLFHVEGSCRQMGAEIEEKEDELKGAENQVQTAETGWKEAKKQQAKGQKDLLAVEKRVKAVQKVVQEEAPRAMQIEERLKFIKSQMANLKGSEERAEKDLIEQEREMKIAGKELVELEEAAGKFEEVAEAKLKAASINAKLLEEYNELKGVASERTAKERLKLESLQRKLAPDLAIRDQLEGKRSELKIATNRISQEHENLLKKQTEVNHRVKRPITY